MWYKDGSFICNNKYQRILIHTDGRFLIEVKVGSSSLHLEHPQFSDCVFGREDIPNQLPYRTEISAKDTYPGGSIFRLWDFLRTNLKLEERCIFRNSCPSSDLVSGFGFASDVPHVKVTIHDAESVRRVLDGVNTFNDAKNALNVKLRKATGHGKRVTKQQEADKDDKDDGDEGRGEVGGVRGQGRQIEGRASGKTRKRDDNRTTERSKKSNDKGKQRNSESMLPRRA